MADPRFFLAAERTLLAWVRTGLTVVAMGFVISRFGLFLRFVAGNAAAQGTATSVAHWLGILLVLIGSIGIVLAVANYRSMIRTLPAADVPTYAVPWLTEFMAVALAVIGFGIAAFLLLS